MTMIHDAVYWKTIDDSRLVCHLCPAECKIRPGKRGICRSRINQDGKLVTDNYAEAVTVSIDPIEKKPLYHFFPTSQILSTGPNTCNLQCSHCQNWTISQEKVPTRPVMPEQLVKIAGERGSIGVAFTYTEPLMWYEYIRDVAPLLQEAGYKVVLVSNGYGNPEAVSELAAHVDAANIDLKSMDPRFYYKICKGRLEPVLENIRRLHAAGVHLEVTNLVIPEHNDSDDDIMALVDFVASVDDHIPLHFSAYHPAYKLDAPPTPDETLIKARNIAEKRLKYVFLGNTLLDGGGDSRCPNCNNMLIRRTGYASRIEGVEAGRCTECGYNTRIVMEHSREDVAG